MSAGAAHIDFETRSTVDLKKTGSDVYARHPDTEVLCLAYCIGEGPIQIWRQGDTAPNELLDHVANRLPVVGHNVGGFEFPIWNYIAASKYDWPKLVPEQLVCTMAMAYSMSLPGSLEKASAAAGLSVQKDMKGNRVMLALSKPKGFAPDGTPIWITDPEKFEELYVYCKQDVEVERQLCNRLRNLSASEREVWRLDLKINQRGIQVDVDAVKAALKVVEHQKALFNTRIQKITKQFLASYTETGRFKQWIESRGVKDVPGIAKADVIELLVREDLPSDVREALILRQEAAKSSTAKLESMLLSTCPDGRIRGIFQYHGAGTGRWAGRRIQPQNLPRPTLEQTQIEEVFGILGSMK